MQVDLATLLSVNRHRLVAGETGGFLHETEVLGESLRALPLETLPSQAGEGVRHVFLQDQDVSILNGSVLGIAIQDGDRCKSFKCNNLNAGLFQCVDGTDSLGRTKR